MKNPNKNFTGIAKVGLQVNWYPGGVKECNTLPRIAFISNAWSKGVVDIVILPIQPGAVEFYTGVYHISAPETRDPITGGPSRAAIVKGTWEFSDTSVAYLESLDDDSVTPATQAKKAK